MTPKTCPQCHNQDSLVIEQAPDSYAKQVRCLACGYITWLKNYNAIMKKQGEA